jgi:hypothetical protein
MPNYQDGQIYTIRCRSDNTLIYVGSTTMTLARRIAYHRGRGKIDKTKFYTCVNNNWDDWYIELYEVFPCENKQELCKREGEIIREIGNLNSKISGRTQSESNKLSYEKHKEARQEHAKIYREENPDKIKLAHKTYHENHREERLEVSRVYHQTHHQEILEKKKKYREEHKAEISAKRREYYKEVQSKDKDTINKKQNENRAKRIAKKAEQQV